MHLPPSFERPNTDCSGDRMKADTDIGGPGVMFTFLIQSWITLACAAFPAFHAAKAAWTNPEVGAFNGGEDNETHPLGRTLTRSSTLLRPMRCPECRHVADDKRHMSPLVRRATQLLNPLCDLQIITGMGVMIAGFTKWNTISFYHEALVTCYWNLTLNSFWAARSEYMDYETEKRKRGVLRRSFVLFSCVLGTVWQILTYQRELDPAFGGQWDEGHTDHCYRYWDGSSPWPWITGIIIFCISLAFSLTERTKAFHTHWNRCLERVQNWCNRLLQKTRDHCRNKHGLFRALAVGAAGIPSVACWIVIQWIAVWSFGDGFLPFTWVCYFLFNIWNAFDVISLWQLNKDLLPGDEREWGFGQILPLIMLLSIFLSAVDI